MFEHDVAAPRAADGSDGGGPGGNIGRPRTRFEVKVTRLEGNAVVSVMRNVWEQYRRFEVEKRFVVKTTARQKDAETNRFTRHGVKNGLLAAIEICGSAREGMSGDGPGGDFGWPGGGGDPAAAGPEGKASAQSENMGKLDRTLHQVLDIVLAKTVCHITTPAIALFSFRN